MQEETSAKRDRLPIIWAGAYVCVAGFCDLIEWVLNFAGGIGIVINRAITIVYNGGVLLFFAFRGIPFWHTKRLTNNIAGFFIELIPVLDLLPAKTASAIMNIRIVRKEDHEYNKRIEEAQAKNIPKIKKLFLEQQKQQQRMAMLAEREGRRSRRIQELEEERQRKKAEEENEHLIAQEQTAGTRYQYAQDQFQNYQRSQRAA
ncbi:MAG: hypothetical protein G01um101448_208 [Parcubacteria group bacterium Gr01-1014_48]|nr:MAG: hypothetical protein Greene041614_960 [Parcubacteria group bacterium Greene0416_14]TSC74332.1 MAG: hypothetical protein G01um101448_208 [Parcubacteria group bacterium Gr01-1014_48]TSD01032.1 MAG: hypothetical protein Greene101415_533 [Parcubacteria group bacterium Greene1014_15]TSD07724.1 MAG: hypothetical protein Greene07144_787 [Parcubacteria group bacterium Greene0714_4]